MISVILKISRQTWKLQQAVENQDGDIGNVNVVLQTKCYSQAEYLAVFRVIQRCSCLQITHTKLTINDAGHRSTNYVTHGYSWWKFTITRYATKSGQEQTQFVCGYLLPPSDLYDNLHTRKVLLQSYETYNWTGTLQDLCERNWNGGI